MKKNLALIIITAAACLIAAILWLLSVVLSEQFGFFNLNWAFVMICGVAGLCLIIGAITAEQMVAMKKLKLFVGAMLLVAAAVSMVFALTLPENYIWPIVAVICTAAGLISVCVTGGKKWDEGDNHKPGYKDYRTRKAEEAARLEAEQAARAEAENVPEEKQSDDSEEN